MGKCARARWVLRYELAKEGTTVCGVCPRGARGSPHELGFFFTQTEKTALYTENFADTIFRTPSEQSYSTYWQEASRAGNQAMLRADLSTYLTDDILVKVDRMSMAHSLEVRSPLLDQEVVAFMARQPRAVKYTEWNSKILLRSLAQRYLPQAILNRPKQGFAIPLGAWIRGPLRPWVYEILCSQRAEERGLFSAQRIREMIDAHMAHRRDYSQQLWALTMLEAWFRQGDQG